MSNNINNNDNSDKHKVPNDSNTHANDNIEYGTHKQINMNTSLEISRYQYGRKT